MGRLSWIVALLAIAAWATASRLETLKWSEVCRGEMGTEWYGTTEAAEVAEKVVRTQRDNGGWMKNIPIHRLTDSQTDSLYRLRGGRSCLDNGATTMEMRFLAKVWQQSGEERYKAAVARGLDMILATETPGGGWSQYLPRSGGGSYHDYITFNDDLMTNVMRVLRDIAEDEGDFKGMADEAARQRAKAAFDRGLQTILKCQIDDNGRKAAWCAQHDPADYMPAEGRPHEHPSVSGSESASLLSFLMTLPDPSEELKEAITAAVEWLDDHKMEGKAITYSRNDDGNTVKVLTDKPGSCLWGRFIQLGGESGRKVHRRFVEHLKKYSNRTRRYNGKEYNDASNAEESYREDMAYRPMYGIYDDRRPYLRHTYLYNFNDTPKATDRQGNKVETSLQEDNRRNYIFLGNWPQRVIEVEYPQWKRRTAGSNGGKAAE